MKTFSVDMLVLLGTLNESKHTVYLDTFSILYSFPEIILEFCLNIEI